MTENEQNYSRVLSVWKFALFSVASMGFYELYWNYKSWKYFKEKDNLDVSPFWRTLLMPYFMSSLFDRFSDMLKKEGHHVNYPTAILIIFWIWINTTTIWKEPIWLLAHLSFLSFIPVLNSLNVYWKEKSPELKEKPLTVKEIIFLTAGILVFVLALMSSFSLD
ncbi:hypothetical protein EO98_19360 [Methanosarcina sp. 2.H.T.1A.6]|uniref:hypothetical protein n=1 Tax=unclassified Methanosarcina TaxID=2644672 RepID=UPI000622052F|nr:MULTISPECIES: hypothetical protein [unclassified Methanosarcina]KKG18189.1 hypothetical protein EO94_09960 [Methanosarcina sp. 2.H.T.1A.3]KKG19414.1 hypothetical protein EO98_19360 [Methanosarcina sp. 2.H.T.1A.6]KKG25545.1 hypothetical protein EO96_18485 [Methanosarcina sp. 2.H.T.1A.8]KKG26588.1 hypothetical protein EO97_01720 [Methanosarcina sp. 2.H.T.1A.15]